MARYSERTDNMARIIDVANRMTLTPQDDETRQSAWVSALKVAGAVNGYNEKHGDINGADVVHYLALDPDNPASIYSAIRATRENARALRGSITTEMFESINSTWLELKAMDGDVIKPAGRRAFFDWGERPRSSVSRGGRGHAAALPECIPRLSQNLPGPYFRVPGRRAGHIERADAPFVLNAQMPRSLRCCYDRLTETLEDLCGTSAPECQRIAGKNSFGITVPADWRGFRFGAA
jgi:uncharacterized alpha-E superfamily protein